MTHLMCYYFCYFEALIPYHYFVSRDAIRVHYELSPSLCISGEPYQLKIPPLSQDQRTNQGVEDFRQRNPNLFLSHFVSCCFWGLSPCDFLFIYFTIVVRILG